MKTPYGFVKLARLISIDEMINQNEKLRYELEKLKIEINKLKLVVVQLVKNDGYIIEIL